MTWSVYLEGHFENPEDAAELEPLIADAARDFATQISEIVGNRPNGLAQARGSTASEEEINLLPGVVGGG